MSIGHITIQPKILYFGTPVVLVSTENADGTTNLAPMSSAWALGQVVVLGLGAEGQTAQNLTARPDLVINVPGPPLWAAVERLAPLTGRNPVPPHKPTHRYEPAKFEAAGFREQPSRHVRPPRVAECPLQLEARADHARLDTGGDFLIVEARVLVVHADAGIVIPGTDHIDPSAWSPLIYNFRHYFTLGEQLGHSYRSDTPPKASVHRRMPEEMPRDRA
ncbi:MAG: flavin reductase family protein [Acidimicrobiales bacterium]